jgi:hypothetical protein
MQRHNKGKLDGDDYDWRGDFFQNFAAAVTPKMA